MYTDHMPRFENPALCAESDADMWFDYSARSMNSIQQEHLQIVKNICKQCPALNECREYAMQYSGLYGVWGGLDHLERERLQRKNHLPTIDWHSTFNTLSMGRVQYE